MSLWGTVLTSASKSDVSVDRQRVTKSSRTSQQYLYNTTRFFPGRQRCARSACAARCRLCGAAYPDEPYHVLACPHQVSRPARRRDSAVATTGSKPSAHSLLVALPLLTEISH